MDFDAWARIGVLLVRPGAVVMATPLFGTPFAPAVVRLGLTILLAFATAPIVPVPDVSMPGVMMFVTGRELVIGLSIGLAVRLLIAVAEGAGLLAGYQVGLSFGAMIDPQSGVRNTTLAILYTNLALVLCLLLNVHHEVLRAWLASYEALPVGVSAGVDASIATTIARALAFIFLGALRLAAPVIAVLLVVEVMMGLMSRAAPSLNLLVVGAPVRLPIGLLVVAASLAALPTLISRLTPRAFELATAAAAAFR